MKITIIQKRPFEFKGTTAVSYIGFREDGTGIKFSSKNFSHQVAERALKFDEKKSEEIELESPSFWLEGDKLQTKWFEVGYHE